jgi:FkbM family methyltransferase
MLSFFESDFSQWLSSWKVFRDWYRLLLYRSLYIFKKDPSMVFTLHTRNGLKIKVRMEDIGSIFECWLFREYFPKWPYTLPDGSTVVDVGASIGLFSLLIAANYHESHVLSYEPLTKCFNLLSENVGANHLEKRVKVHNVAVSSIGGERTFYVQKDDIQSSFFKKGGDATIVNTLTIDDVLAEAGKIDFLKMDIEGAEYEVLLNANNSTLRKIKAISLEYHDSILNHDHSELFEKFTNNDYKIEILVKHKSKVTGIMFASRLDAERKESSITSFHKT